MNKRALSLLLALLAVSSTVMAACAEKEDDSSAVVDTTTDAETVPEEELDSLEARKKVSDNLPDQKFEGRPFVILTQTEKRDDYIVEESSADVLEDSIFLRNEKIQERFDIEIQVTDTDAYDTVKSMVIKSVTSGDDEYQLVSYHVCSAGQMVGKQKYLYNLNNVNYLDFSRPWWSESTVKDLTYDGVTLLAVGDVALSAMYATYCMFFNKSLASDYNMNDMYGLVQRGEWTIDKLEELTKDVYVDDGNGKRDNKDFYGYAMSNGSPVNTFLWAFDNPVYKKNSEDQLEYVFKTEKVGEIINRVYGLLFDNPGTFCRDYAQVNTSTAEDMYRKNQVLIVPGTFETAIKWRDLEMDYGIIPYPKWDENQENYQTMSDGGHAIVALPYSCQDPDFSGIIIEALCAESWKTVVPTYYDVALKVKGTRDEESVAILDMIFEHRVFDFGYVYDAFDGVCFFFQRMMQAKNKNFESYYASNSKGALRHYEKVIEAFENYDD